MNKVILTNARLVKDVDLKQANDLSIARFTVAVNRQFKKDEADFISCVAFGKRAETINTYFKKGSLIALEGRIQTGKYEKDGQTIYTTDVVVDNFEFPKISDTIYIQDNKIINDEEEENTLILINNNEDKELPF